MFYLILLNRLCVLTFILGFFCNISNAIFLFAKHDNILQILSYNFLVTSFVDIALIILFTYLDFNKKYKKNKVQTILTITNLSLAFLNIILTIALHTYAG